MRDDSDAQDAAQEVFLRLVRREKTGQLQSEARSYMVKAVYHSAIDVERWRTAHHVQDSVAVEESQHCDPAIEVAEALYWREGLHRLVDALNELGEITQQVFALYHIQGMTHAAIAGQLKISVRSVERHMARAIAHCENRLREYLR